MKVIFLFLDGVGVGNPEPSQNPFLLANTPFLDSILHGQKLSKGINAFHSDLVSVFELDACVGVAGIPQSATGQAMLLTGQNIPQHLGYHYGPKPNPDIARYLTNGNLFNVLQARGYHTCYLNAFPPTYFENIASRKRLYSAIPLAVTSAGIRLRSLADLVAGNALSADFTAEGWRTHLGFQNIPTLSLDQAAKRIAEIACRYDLAFFEYWLTDYAGHHQNMAEAIRVLETIDRVLESLVNHWELSQGMIWMTSDHGNIEDLSHRHHTLNPVPLLIFGSPSLRKELPFFQSLLDIYPALLKLFS
jgi:2,3-bisphosphoglycerate-independent phosphoglycerate mutase